MNDIVREFLQKERICVLSLLLPDQSIHSSTLHYAFDGTNYHFVTEKRTLKSTTTKDQGVASSVVIGFSEKEWLTIQAKGETCQLSGEELELAWESYISKYPDSKSTKNNSEFILLSFIPSWWRFTDLNHTPWVIYTSTK